ncbi:MAG TPA: SAM-dependent methyltransferase [Gammaproteobacteria bacterium]
MIRMRKTVGILMGLAVGLGLSSIASAELAPGFDSALASDARPAEEKARDAARKPAEVLNFVGIGEGMTVLEISAGAGWYTEVLSAAVGRNGSVIAQNSPRFEERIGESARARAIRLGNVEIRFAEIADLGLTNEVEAAFTALNLHDAANRSDEAGMAFLSGIHAALEPGGVLGLVDHVGVAGQNNAELHRMEKATAIDMLERAGFVVEAESDILMNSADDHTLNIRDDAIRFNTDRMLIRARKPE